MRCCTTRPLNWAPIGIGGVRARGGRQLLHLVQSSCAPIASTSTCCCSTLRGHGQSNQLQQVVKGHSFRAVTEDILRLLDHLRIPMPASVGISLGAHSHRHLAELCP